MNDQEYAWKQELRARQLQAKWHTARVRQYIVDNEPYSKLIPAIIEKCRQFKNWRLSSISTLANVEQISRQNAKALISEFCTERILDN